MDKIKSGVIGINTLFDGGINKNSITTVIGAAGSGKTTFATQFLRRGLETGYDGLFISLDENKEQLITEAKEMGWYSIQDYMDSESLIFRKRGDAQFRFRMGRKQYKNRNRSADTYYLGQR
jgi:KaiC/GvpD/RAD55 family RecA-like ATPase